MEYSSSEGRKPQMKRGSRDPTLKILSNVASHHPPFAPAAAVSLVVRVMKVSSVLVGGMTFMLKSVSGGAVPSMMDLFFDTGTRSHWVGELLRGKGKIIRVIAIVLFFWEQTQFDIGGWVNSKTWRLSRITDEDNGKPDALCSRQLSDANRAIYFKA